MCVCVFVGVAVYLHKRSALLGEPLSAGGPPVQVVTPVISCSRIPVVCLVLLDPCSVQLSRSSRSASSTTAARGCAWHQRP